MGGGAGASKPEWVYFLCKSGKISCRMWHLKLISEGNGGVKQAKSREIVFQAQETACAKFLRPEGA